LVSGIEGLWLSAALICFLLELVTLNLYTICISLGALFAWLSVHYGLSVWMSAGSFVLVTIALIILLRPPLARWLLPSVRYTWERDTDDY
jgi:membrane protein implicated in regulation of membrane protease activity